MTTLIGVKAEKGIEGVVLASDLSKTQTKWNAQGDVAYRQQIRLEGQKIYINDKNEFALCMSGIFDQLYADFLSRLLKGDIDLRKITQDSFFPELKNLNEERWEGRVPNNDYINGLLLATRFDNKAKLYTCWPLGKVEEKVWTSVGSGSDYAADYISNQGKLIPKYLALDEAVDLAVSGLDEASQDIYTGGLDLVVVTPNKILDFGEDIKKAINYAKAETIKNIKQQLNR